MKDRLIDLDLRIEVDTSVGPQRNRIARLVSGGVRFRNGLLTLCHKS
jgi:hypothetical protein